MSTSVTLLQGYVYSTIILGLSYMLYLSSQLLLAILVLLVIYWELLLFRAKGAPFITSPKSTRDNAFSLLKIDESSVVYDLGCGNAQTLVDFYRLVPEANYLGVDQSPFAYFASKINIFASQAGKNIRINQGDLIKTNLSKATHIYIWLSPQMMRHLLPKFKKELHKGTKVVSCDYPFLDTKPAKVFDCQTKGVFGKRLYLYRF